MKNKPVELPTGELVCGSSIESWSAWTCWVDITPDHGRHWSKHYGIIQPTLFVTPGERIRILCRSTRRIRRIVIADSVDDGRSWSTARPTTLPNPNSGIDAVRLEDGRVALVYNHSTSTRTPLNVAISEDFGQSWMRSLTLESGEGEFSYPAIIQTPDHTIHITYTWNRGRIRYITLTLDEL